MARLKTKVDTTYIIELTEDEYIKVLQCINLSTILPRDLIQALNIDHCKEVTQDGKTK